jgi:hypothetical protein
LFAKNIGILILFLIDDAEVGMRGDSAEYVKKDILGSLLSEPLALRLQRPREPSTFDANRPGHVIKLIVGLVQEYGALKVDEIVGLLRLLNVPKETADVHRYALCARAVGWLKEISKGSSDYFVAVNTKIDAATIFSKEGAGLKNKQRRRLSIREHWKAYDE